MKKKDLVPLTDEERTALQGMIASGKRAVRTLTQARTLRNDVVQEDGSAEEDATIRQIMEARAVPWPTLQGRWYTSPQ